MENKIQLNSEHCLINKTEDMLPCNSYKKYKEYKLLNE